MEHYDLNVIVTSKNRPAQLDLLLRSMIKNFKEIKKIHVLYKSTTNDFDAGYELLKEKLNLDNIFYVKEKNFKGDYLSILNNITTNFFMNFCDDNVVIDDFGIDFLLKAFESDEDIINVSLRLNPKYNFCYTAQKNIDIPDFEAKENYIKWDWTKCDPNLDWGYCQPQDTNIYKTNEYKNLVSKFNIHNACIEDELHISRNRNKKYMIAPTKTKIITIANNRAQDWNANMFHSKKQEYSLENLTLLYLNKKQIRLDDIEQLKNKDILQGHLEYDFQFVDFGEKL